MNTRIVLNGRKVMRDRDTWHLAVVPQLLWTALDDVPICVCDECKQLRKSPCLPLDRVSVNLLDVLHSVGIDTAIALWATLWAGLSVERARALETTVRLSRHAAGCRAALVRLCIEIARNARWDVIELARPEQWTPRAVDIVRSLLADPGPAALETMWRLLGEGALFALAFDRCSTMPRPESAPLPPDPASLPLQNAEEQARLYAELGA